MERSLPNIGDEFRATDPMDFTFTKGNIYKVLAIDPGIKYKIKITDNENSYPITLEELNRYFEPSHKKFNDKLEGLLND